jgi:Mn2+/Fe2+ NRAMP family transporter
MNVDVREWDDQESALESLRSGNPIANEARKNQYKLLFTALASQPIPALSRGFASRVALLAYLRSDKARKIERHFEYGLTATMLAAVALVAGLVSIFFGTAWLKPLLSTNPWLKASLVCVAVLAIVVHIQREGNKPAIPG